VQLQKYEDVFSKGHDERYEAAKKKSIIDKPCGYCNTKPE